jgi:hypothetical protein
MNSYSGNILILKSGSCLYNFYDAFFNHFLSAFSFSLRDCVLIGKTEHAVVWSFRA